MFRKLILLIVSSIAIFSTAVFAVGLGESKLQSGLNQPLKAEISLLSVADLAEHELQMSLATAQEFDKVGVEFLYFLNDIRFKTVRNAQGKMIVTLESRDTIKEPFLNFVVALNYPKGRFVKEYTFLLDPPIFEKAAAPVISQAQTAKPAKVETKRVEKASSQASFSGSTYGAVSSTDTLWGIASKTRPNSDVSIHQTLVAIYRANPQAFANGNINNLLRGEVLQIPDAETISKIPQRAALQDIVVQNKQWKSGSTRKIVENTTAKSSAKASSGEARLSLATQDTDSSSSINSSKLNAELIRAQETSATLQAENEELRSRLNDLLQKLDESKTSAINVADAELAALTQTQRDKELESATVAGNEVESVEPINDQNAEEQPVDNINSDNSQSEATTDSEAQVNDSKLEEPKKSAIDSTQSIPVVSAPVEEKSFADEILDSSYFLVGIIVTIILIVILVFWRMRKRMEEEDFQDDLVASAGAGSMDNTEEFELPDVGDDMLVDLDMDEPDEFNEPREESFDPLGEADIYIAYGKFEQAESLLLDSIEDNPIRSDLKVKLMECYAESENKDKFEALADEVAQSADAEEWSIQINRMRDNTWMKSADSSDEFDLPSTEDIFGDETVDFGSEEDTEQGASKGINLSEGQGFDLDDEAEFDKEESFNLDDEDSLDEEQDFNLDAVGDEEFDLDLDAELDEAEVKPSQAVTETFNALDDDFSLDDDVLDDDIDSENSLDIDSDDFETNDSDDIALEEDTLSLDDDAVMDLEEENFDFENDEESLFESSDDDSDDEISTKLDLARAYIDMGDSEGAKDILTEVLSDGNDSQKAEAKELLEKAD